MSKLSGQTKTHTATPPPEMISGLAYDFPLRRDFLAQIVLPCDLRSEEAKRLTAFISALVAPASEEGR